MSDLLIESEEALKQERLMAYWRENSTFIITMIVLTILLTGGMSFYRGWDKSMNERQTAKVIEMTEATDFPANVTAAIAADELKLRKDIKGLLLLRAVGAYRAQGDSEAAQNILTGLTKGKGISDIHRDLAIVISAQMGNADEARLADVAGDDKNPWQALALLEYARILADKGETEAAVQQLDKVENITIAPDTIRERARSLRSEYSAK